MPKIANSMPDALPPTGNRDTDKVLTYLRTYINQEGKQKRSDGRWWYVTPLKTTRHQINMGAHLFQLHLDILQARGQYEPIDDQFGRVHYL